MQNEQLEIDDNKQPLNNETFREIMADIDQNENTRTDDLIRQRRWTNLWLFIIAMYCLIQIIIKIVPLLLGIYTLETLF